MELVPAENEPLIALPSSNANNWSVSGLVFGRGFLSLVRVLTRSDRWRIITRNYGTVTVLGAFDWASFYKSLLGTRYVCLLQQKSLQLQKQISNYTKIPKTSSALVDPASRCILFKKIEPRKRWVVSKTQNKTQIHSLKHRQGYLLTPNIQKSSSLPNWSPWTLLVLNLKQERSEYP